MCHKSLKINRFSLAVSAIHYSISSGDADSHFYIDRLSGKIFTNDGNLDHEQNTAYLLSVTAETENPPVFGKAQVCKKLNDHYSSLHSRGLSWDKGHVQCQNMFNFVIV